MREGTAVRFWGTGVQFKQGVTPAPHIRARQPWVSSDYGHMGDLWHNILWFILNTPWHRSSELGELSTVLTRLHTNFQPTHQFQNWVLPKNSLGS